MGWPKYQIGAIKVIRFFELIGFLTAYIILNAFFNKIDCNKVEVTVIVFFVSLIVIKTDLLFYCTNNIKEIISNCLKTGKLIIIGIIKSPVIFFKFVKNSILNYEIFFLKLKSVSHAIPSQILRFLKYFSIIFKQVFFNVCYDIFPILLIWLSVSGFFVIFDIISIPGIEDNLNNILAFSILLGIFQYFLKRHEEKIYPKISFLPNKINAIIAEETVFIEFYESIRDTKLERAIKRAIDPKLQTLDFYDFVLNDPKFSKMYFASMKKNPPISFQPVINYQYNSDQQYLLAEMEAKRTNQETELHKAYSDFFLGIAYDNINNKIKSEVDINEFAILTQSNINIVQEVIPQFINLKLQNGFDKITDGSDIIALPTDSSANEFKEHLKEKIYSEIWAKILP